MMSLVVKEVYQRRTERVSKFLAGIGLVTEWRVKSLRRDCANEILDLEVGPRALAPQFLEIGI